MLAALLALAAAALLLAAAATLHRWLCALLLPGRHLQLVGIFPSRNLPVNLVPDLEVADAHKGQEGEACNAGNRARLQHRAGARDAAGCGGG